MHSAIRAADQLRDPITQACKRLPAQYETSDEMENEGQHTAEEISQSTPRGPSNSSPHHDRLLNTSSWKRESLNGNGHNLPPLQDYSEYLQVAMPTFSEGTTTTFGYQQALRNRIFASKLAHAGKYDPSKYTPTFLHDCLMLPGSLANVLGKTSSLDIIQRMTPAFIPGFLVTKHSVDGNPCLVRSHNPNDYAQGMLIFGQGKTGRDRIHSHYRSSARRVKVPVEIDVVVFMPGPERDSEVERWRLQRRKILAHVWLTSKVHAAGGPRSLEEWLEGEIEDDGDLRIDPSAYGIEEDGRVSVRCNTYDEKLTEMREVVQDIRRGGYGSLDYERVEIGWGGW